MLSARELERLRSPISSATLSLRADETERAVADEQRLSPKLEAVDHRLITASLDAERASTRLDVPARFSCDDANQLCGFMWRPLAAGAALGSVHPSASRLAGDL